MSEQADPSRIRRVLQFFFGSIRNTIVTLVVLVILCLAVLMNWWRFSYRESRVLGLTEIQLIERFGEPDMDTSGLYPWQSGGNLPPAEAEGIESNRDEATDYDLIWYTGIGTTHALVRLQNGIAVDVEHGTHR